MATATYTVTTGSSDLAAIKRKAQAGIKKAAQFGVEEVSWFKGTLPKFEVAASQREITCELDILDGTGATFITEGNKEARPSSPSAVTATIAPLLMNKRFTVSRHTQIIETAQGRRPVLEPQLKWQARKAAEAINRKIGDTFYGFSTGVVAKLDVISGAPDYVLKDLYGIAGLGSTSHNLRVVDQFVVAASGSNLDYVAALNPTGPALRSIAGLTAKVRSTNTVTASAAFSSDEISDWIVYANSLENTTITGTESALNPVGILDGMTSASVHGVSGSTYDKWSAYADTAGGDFSGIRLMKMQDNIMNRGGGKMDLVIWAQGVKNRVVQQLQGGLRFTDAYGMEMDGSAKAKGVQFKTSRRVPDGYVFAFDSSNSITKLLVTGDDPDVPDTFDAGDKLQDDSGSVFSSDFMYALIWQNRANAAYASGLTQA